MPYGHLLAATMMTLGIYQGHSSIAIFFSILTSTSRSASAIAELLVLQSWTLSDGRCRLRLALI